MGTQAEQWPKPWVFTVHTRRYHPVLFWETYSSTFFEDLHLPTLRIPRDSLAKPCRYWKHGPITRIKCGEKFDLGMVITDQCWQSDEHPGSPKPENFEGKNHQPCETVFDWPFVSWKSIKGFRGLWFIMISIETNSQKILHQTCSIIRWMRNRRLATWNNFIQISNLVFLLIKDSTSGCGLRAKTYAWNQKFSVLGGSGWCWSMMQPYIFYASALVHMISQYSVLQQQNLCLDIPLTLVYRQLPAKRNIFERLKTISSGKCALNIF